MLPARGPGTPCRKELDHQGKWPEGDLEGQVWTAMPPTILMYGTCRLQSPSATFLSYFSLLIIHVPLIPSFSTLSLISLTVLLTYIPSPFPLCLKYKLNLHFLCSFYRMDSKENEDYLLGDEESHEAPNVPEGEEESLLDEGMDLDIPEGPRNPCMYWVNNNARTHAKTNKWYSENFQVLAE